MIRIKAEELRGEFDRLVESLGVDADTKLKLERFFDKYLLIKEDIYNGIKSDISSVKKDVTKYNQRCLDKEGVRDSLVTKDNFADVADKYLSKSLRWVKPFIAVYSTLILMLLGSMLYVWDQTIDRIDRLEKTISQYIMTDIEKTSKLESKVDMIIEDHKQIRKELNSDHH